MPQHHEKRSLPYSPEQLYTLVADVARYQEFLPWCVGSRINWRKNNIFNADVLIGYSIFREVFNSTVMLSPNSRIDVTYQKGPFKHLHNHWIFHPTKNLNETEIEFFIDFEFQTSLLNTLIKTVFEEAVVKMVQAFEDRAKAVYGHR